MTRTTKVSSVANRRIHNLYVDRVRSVSRTEETEAVEPVGKVKNQTAFPSANYLMVSDAFYENLEELKKEYKKFYHDHRKLEEAIKELNYHDDQFLDHMKNLIEKYNSAMNSLKTLDKALGTNRMREIEEILEAFEDALRDIGITLNEEKEMNMEEDIFVKKIGDYSNTLTFLFEPVKGMVIRLYKAFKNIKLPSKNPVNKQYDGFIDGDVSGMLMNEKS
ncbi:hypothetical protein CACET_c13670 [Clostridium aceticum]|uniref:Uncharacterized protein n=1 Tax=Clostridium aceticum TaxID=84022 RepID=A0A0D8IEX7_9CLOT|nr:hypothetical protein [Clostridium aceticum]AKL94832.1 hypothetical protein CACET_c13670 [Clostridium aceticum]KJF27766.1 hypothetical protein TZ02_03960 [Clostridium aceticum]